MILVWILLGGIVLGFIASVFIFSYFHADEKTIIQRILCVMSLIILACIAIYLYTINWSHALSFIIGVGVGFAMSIPTDTKKEKDESE